MASDGLVIVGASLAGAKAAEGARDGGWAGAIRLAGAEWHLPYERPPLSKGVMQGSEQPSVARVHGDGFYAGHEIEILLGAAATGIDLADSTVTLAGGRRLRFDKLVLATGSTVRRIPVPGAELDGVCYLRSLDDALALRDLLQPGRRLAVVGVSWIGTEVAASARQRGTEVVMVDPLSQPLERVLGPEVGRYFARLHTDHGVKLRLGTGVEAFAGDGRVEAVRLTDGSAVDADAVVVGIGVNPNVDLARSAGLAVDQGVLVDAHLTTSHPDVFAAGDIAEHHHPVLGARVRVEHWANALNQGLTAGANATGAGQVYDGIPYFFSDQYDMGMEYSGWATGYDRVVFRGDPEDGAFVAFYLSGERVVGGVNVNVWDVNAQVQALVRSAAPADIDAITDPDVDPATWTP
ncbi:MAG TPA: FAD-dependent oxidoreductase [Jiangellaceae bacterium]|nr:FAD-dependent oxidoreductase [Jiangellaceae bacterium]